MYIPIRLGPASAATSVGARIAVTGSVSASEGRQQNSTGLRQRGIPSHRFRIIGTIPDFASFSDLNGIFPGGNSERFSVDHSAGTAARTALIDALTNTVLPAATAAADHQKLDRPRTGYRKFTVFGKYHEHARTGIPYLRLFSADDAEVILRH